MSLLNLALQNVALERSPTSADIEKILSDCKSMGDIRDACSSNSSFKEAYSLSMKPVIELLKCRFSRMKLKESALEASCGVSKSDIEELFQEINIIDSTLVMQKLNRKDCDKASEWKLFISIHCKISLFISSQEVFKYSL